MQKSIILTRDMCTSAVEEQLLVAIQKDAVDLVVSTVLKTFSAKEAQKKIAAFGFSRHTAQCIVTRILEDEAVRSDLSDSFKTRTAMCGLGFCVFGGLYFVPSIPVIFTGMIAICLVYGLLSLTGWLRYSRPAPFSAHRAL
jgi:hypothetical protein